MNILLQYTVIKHFLYMIIETRGQTPRLCRFIRYIRVVYGILNVAHMKNTCVFIMMGVESMSDKNFDLNYIVEMKKPHPCGENEWRIIRMGMDIRIKCLGCDHSVMLPRREFERKMKKIIQKANAE